PYLLAILQLPQAALERAPSRSAPGGVAIEAKHNFIGLPQQFLQVHRSGGRAQRGHRAANTILSERDHIHVTPAHTDSASTPNGLSRLEQTVDVAPLLEQRGLRGVQVLGLRVVHPPPAKADDLAA